MSEWMENPEIHAKDYEELVALIQGLNEEEG